jgi:hypothetical protein
VYEAFLAKPTPRPEFSYAPAGTKGFRKGVVANPCRPGLQLTGTIGLLD